MEKKVLNFAIIVLALAISSCSKKGDTGPAGATGPAGPAYKGAISGHVILYDQYGSRVYSGLNSVNIQLNGAAAINGDNSGYYLFGGLTTGDYEIATSASGYASSFTNKFQFLGDTLNRDLKLSAIPNFSPLSMSSYAALSSPGDSMVLTFAAYSRARNCILFVNNTSAVGSQPANYLLVYIKAVPANQTKISFVIPAGDLYDAGLLSGSTFYCAAYGYVTGDVSVYEDLTTGKNVYNAVSANPVTATGVTP